MTSRRPCLLLALLGSSAGVVPLSSASGPPALVSQNPQLPSMPVFRTGIDRVTLFATVRDRRGRLVPSLSRGDFELLDQGERRPIIDFEADRSPLSVALLLDVSGSMAVGSNVQRARLAGQQVLQALEPGTDEAALYAFDSELRELRPFSTDVRDLAGALDRVTPFGTTSIWDAVAAAAPRVVERGSQRRALVVLTDGADTSSRSDAREVSGLASAVDLPVYVVATEPPLNESRMESLANLAQWTGGTFHVVADSARAAAAARQIVEELKHQYFLAFEASIVPGWHPIVVRTRNSALSVRARSGYFVGH